MNFFKEKLTRLYGQMYMDFGDYPPYIYALWGFFETRINSNIQCCHGYPNSSKNYRKAALADKKNWGIIDTTFPEELKLINFPKTIVRISSQMVNDLEYDNDDLNPMGK